MTALLRDLTARGLLSVPSPKRPSKPLGKNALYRVLTNPYYAGVIRYKGALHPGAHAPIVEPALFDQVQSLLKARNAHATRHVQHAHHLKGLLHCGTCGSRMLLDFATNPRGTTYAYFVCSGRAAKKTTCTRRAVPVQVAERLVESSYGNITISEAEYRHLAAEVDAAFDKRSAGRDQEFADLTANRARLEAESDKLLAAHFADAIDLATLKRHQDRIRAGLADVNRRLAEHSEHHTGGRAFLHDSLRLLTDAHRAYQYSGDADRRIANQAFYTRLDITDDEQLRPTLAEPFATIFREAHQGGDEGKEAKREHTTSFDVACSRKTLWVDLRSSFSNPRKPLGSLISRVLRGSRARRPRTRGAQIADERGPVRENSRQSQTRLSVSNRAELIAGYADGVPVRELATRFNVHRGTVREIARQAGLAARRPELPDATRQDAAQLYAGGLTLAQVAARLAVSTEAVRSAVIASGGTIRAGGRRRVGA
mgnify:CR=1 FL=1